MKDRLRSAQEATMGAQKVFQTLVLVAALGGRAFLGAVPVGPVGKDWPVAPAKKAPLKKGQLAPAPKRLDATAPASTALAKPVQTKVVKARPASEFMAGKK